MLPRVAIIILNWNNAADTLQCLNSVRQQSYDNLLTIVVDNASEDESVRQIRMAYPDTAVIVNHRNLGYAEGNNVGMAYALGLHPQVDYLCILNNDTTIAPDFIARLVATAESDPTIGIVGPKMYTMEPANQLFAAGSSIDWQQGRLNHRGIGWRESAESFFPQSADVDFIVGCGVLIRRGVLEEIGLFDTRYFLNFEDVDLCMRVRVAGYRVYYEADAHLWHRVSASLGQGSPRNTYYMVRNAFLFFGTHRKRPQRWWTHGRVLVRTSGHVAVWTVKHAGELAYQRKRVAALFGIRDAMLGRYGEMGADVARKCIG